MLGCRVVVRLSFGWVGAEACEVRSCGAFKVGCVCLSGCGVVAVLGAFLGFLLGLEVVEFAGEGGVEFGAVGGAGEGVFADADLVVEVVAGVHGVLPRVGVVSWVMVSRFGGRLVSAVWCGWWGGWLEFRWLFRFYGALSVLSRARVLWSPCLLEFVR